MSCVYPDYTKKKRPHKWMEIKRKCQSFKEGFAQRYLRPCPPSNKVGVYGASVRGEYLGCVAHSSDLLDLQQQFSTWGSQKVENHWSRHWEEFEMKRYTRCLSGAPTHRKSCISCSLPGVGVVVGLRNKQTNKKLWPSDHIKPKACLWNKILLEHSHAHYTLPQAASVPVRQI